MRGEFIVRQRSPQLMGQWIGDVDGVGWVNVRHDRRENATIYRGEAWQAFWATKSDDFEIVPIAPPEPDAIDAAIEAYVGAPCEVAPEVWAPQLRAIIDAALTEVDRKIAAALAPAELAERMARMQDAAGNENSAERYRNNAARIRERQAKEERA